jgi:NAD(P) transhydrogenase
MDYDLLVIGEDRCGIERAMASARSGDRVGVVKPRNSMTSLDTMRLAAFNIAENGRTSMAAWRAEAARLNGCQCFAENAELDAAGVELIYGSASFKSSSIVEVRGRDDRREVSCREFVLACGCRSRLPRYLQENGRFVVTLETLLNLNDVPRSMIVVGGGESGLSAAIMLAGLGVEVTVVDEHATLSELCGLFDAKFDAIQTLNIAFRLDDEVVGTELRPNRQTAVRLASGRVLAADAVLVCLGKEGNTEGLNLDAVGVGIDEHGRVWCDPDGQTWTSHISAVGDVVGFPQSSVVPPSHIRTSLFAFAR